MHSIFVARVVLATAEFSSENWILKREVANTLLSVLEAF